MKIRRVVTGHAPNGKAIVASDTEVDAITVAIAPGFEAYNIWGADDAPTFPDDGSPRSAPAYFPPVGGFRFGFNTFPPQSVTLPEDFDLDAGMKELEEKFPGMGAYMEPDAPGMHATNTIDFAYIISGEVWLELDDGKQVHLQAGDTFIQNGTRHAWRNKGTEPCRIVGCMVGAHRK